MGLLEEQAQFLTAKYGTAAGPTGIHATPALSFNLATIMVLLGLLIFAAILFVVVRDWQTMQTLQKARQME